MRGMLQEDRDDLARRQGGDVWKELVYVMFSLSSPPLSDEERTYIQPCVGLPDGGGALVAACLTNNERLVCYRRKDGETVFFPIPYRRDEIADTKGNNTETVTRLTVGDPGGIVYRFSDRRRGLTGKRTGILLARLSGYVPGEDKDRLYSCLSAWTQDDRDYILALPPWNASYEVICGVMRNHARRHPGPEYAYSYSPDLARRMCLVRQVTGGARTVIFAAYERGLEWSGQYKLNHSGFSPSAGTLIGTGRKGSYVREHGVTYLVHRRGVRIILLTEQEAVSEGVWFDMSDADMALAAEPPDYAGIQQRLSERAMSIGARIDFVESSPNGHYLPFSFRIGAVSYDGRAFSFDLKSYSNLNWRFPFRMMSKGVCPWEFRGCECRYSGPDETCDHTIPACLAKGNIARIGCFPGCGVGGLAR